MNEKDTSVKIADIREGQEFIGFYALKRCEVKEYEGGSRLDIELSDATGSLPGVIWDNVHDLKMTVKKGDVVKVKGRLSSYHDKPQVQVKQIRAAEDGEYDPVSFIPSTSKDIAALANRVKELIETIQEPHLRELGKRVFDNARFMKDFALCPGGTKWHHPYIGGLIEHSVGVAEMCDSIARQYPEINRDLLVLGALLHDVGKVREFTTVTTIEYTDEGRLEGHIVIGERMVTNVCGDIEGFPPKLKMIMRHLMLSHQGKRDFGSPVEPMIPEAFALYYADEIDSKLNALWKIMESTRKEGKTWSDYINLLGRFIYVDRGEEQG